MRVKRNQLIFLSLCVLDQAVDDCREGPVPLPAHDVRLALAILHAVGKAPRAGFDDFWKTIRSPAPPGEDEKAHAKIRNARAREQFYGMAKAVGVPITASILLQLAHARQRGHDRHAFQMLCHHEANADRVALSQWRRRGRECQMTRVRVW